MEVEKWMDMMSDRCNEGHVSRKSSERPAGKGQEGKRKRKSGGFFSFLLKININ